jgi:putative transposase
MPNYRRAYEPGGTYFLTIATYQRLPLLGPPQAVTCLRSALGEVMREAPFQIPAAVILPDHIHFLWSLPRGDADYSGRVGRMKVRFTRSIREAGSPPPDVSPSRRRHRESDVWQRRFWEYTVRDEPDFERLLDYIHYNPVRHGLATCPHRWPFSSFRKWVRSGLYSAEWGCSCRGRRPNLPVTVDDGADAGE